MTEGIDYAIHDTSISGSRTRMAVDLLNPAATAPGQFFRVRFSIVE